MTKRKSPRIKKTHPHTHHLVRSLLVAMMAEELRVSEACGMAGLHRSTMSKWVNHAAEPDLQSLEALGEVMGLRLVWKRGETDE